jgi:hypothetical protein
MKGIDTLPPGPLLKGYEFRITYYEQPIDEMYRSTVTARLMAGMSPLQAVQGTPLTVDKAKRWRDHLKLSRKDEKKQFRLVGDKGCDGYDIVTMFYQQKMTYRDIAQAVGCSIATVFRMLKAMDVNDARAFRSKNKTQRMVNHLKKAGSVRASKVKKEKEDPGYRKYRIFVKNRGHKYLPVYQDIANGMTAAAACRKHKVVYQSALKHFKKHQRLSNQFLEFGHKVGHKIFVTRAMWGYWEKAAQKEGIIMLDWIKKHLNAAASRHAGNQPRDNGPKAGYNRVPEIADARGEVRSLLQGVRSVHERPAPAESDASCPRTEDVPGSVDAARAEQGLGADAASTEVDHQHGSERKANQHGQDC